MTQRVLITLAALLAFSPLFTAGWTWWDDPATLHHNPRMNPPTLAGVAHYWTAAGPNAPMSLYIPLSYTGWSALAAVSSQPADADGIRLNPHTFHTANVLLHAITALLVFELLRTLLSNDTAAATGALLFALHPVQVEAVGWISGGKDVLCGCLSIAALWQYVLWVQRRAAWRYVLASLLLMAAILSKPTAIVVPLMAGTLDGLVLRRPWKQVLQSLWPWLLLTLPAAVLTRWSQPADWSNTLPLWSRPPIAADALAHQLTKLIAPFQLAPDEGRRPATVLAHGWLYYTWLIPAGLVVVFALRPRRWRAGWMGGLLFLIPLLPVLGLVPFEFQYVSTTTDHYLYLAMLGPALLLASMVRVRPRLGVVAGAGLLILTVLSFHQTLFWRTNRALFEHTLAVNRASFIACDMLGYDHTLEANQLLQAARNDPSRANALAAQAHDQYETALAYFRRGLSINPKYVPSLVNLAIDSQRIGRPGRCPRRRRSNRRPYSPVLPAVFRAEPVDLARLLFTFGDPPAAARVLRRWLLIHPTDPRRPALACTSQPAPGHALTLQTPTTESCRLKRQTPAGLGSAFC